MLLSYKMVSILDQYRSLLHFKECLDVIAAREPKQFGFLSLSLSEKKMMLDVCKVVEIIKKYITIFCSNDNSIWNVSYHFKKFEEEIRKCDVGSSVDRTVDVNREENSDSDDEDNVIGSEEDFETTSVVMFDGQEIDTLTTNILQHFVSQNGCSH